MQTSAIRYRVVDFLKEYPPFQAMDEDDLLALVEQGRVRFHEIDEHVYWQGKPAGDLFFVVQQGAVSLYEEEGQGERLRDVRGPGDLLGIDRLLGRAAYRHSARAASDLILYGLPAAQMQPLLAKYPSAGRYLAAHASVSASYEPPDPWRRLDRAFAHDTSRQRPLLSCAPSDSVREAVRRMNEAGAGAIAVLSPQGTLVDILTSERVLQRLGDGTLSPERPVEALRDGPPGTVSPSVTVDQCLLAMVDRPEGVVALTDGGLPDGRVHALVTAADLGPVFGEEPLGLLHDLAHAPSLPALAALNQRVRRFVLQQLASPASVDWLSLLSCRFDQRLLARAISLLGLPGGGDRSDEVGWFFFGASGRAESMTPLIPQVGLVFADGSREASKTALEWHRTLWEALLTCGYVGARELPPTGASFACASLDEWKDRFRRYVRDPIASAIYNARPLFDLRPLVGDGRLVAQVQDVVREEVKAAPAFVLLLANDCLTNMPPLAFFRNAVVEETGQKTETLHLWRSALLPLVDVGRVLALDGGRFAGEATLDRFAFARERHPSQESVFREAADSLRVMLYHNARAGIRRQDGGAEIDPASLSRYDRQILKSGFASIHRLLELMATDRWRRGE